MAGTEVPIEWHGRPGTAWLPAPLTDRSVNLSERTVRVTERAAAAIRRSAERLPPQWEPLGHLLLRAEGLSSSQIEGVRAPLPEVVAAEQGDRGVSGDARLIADNLMAIEAAVGAAGESLTLEILLSWHRLLMRNGDTLMDEHVGALRTVQGWVGGPSPLTAAYVPPPAEYLGTLMRDLLVFANGDAVDPVTQAALVHAQFETMHPFADGNGRIGRALISWVLARRLGVLVPPPVSVFIALDRGGYLSGLTLFRQDPVDPWVSWLARALERSATAMAVLVDSVDEEIGRQESALSDLRTDATARRVVRLVPELPVLSAPMVAERLGVSLPSARTALETLEARGILEPLSRPPTRPGRPARLWQARWLFDLVGRWAS